MGTKMKYAAIGFIFIIAMACTDKQGAKHVPNLIADSEFALNYLKGLQGKWEVDGGEEGIFGWEFDTTSRGNVVLERLKVGTTTEMLTIYSVDDGILYGNHFCQLQNQPRLTAVNSDTVGDLHFLCDGKVGNATSHEELHMHGVHFQKNDEKMVIWMDMHENGKWAFETRYELTRFSALAAQEITL